MANEELVRKLQQGSAAWNTWASGVTIHQRFDLTRADLRSSDLCRTNLTNADLTKADLSRANLSTADLSGAYLNGADFSNANLTGANLSGAVLAGTIFNCTDLTAAIFRGAFLYETVFMDLDLSRCIGLETCQHESRSAIDIRTLQQSNPLPLAFLRGVGLPNQLIEEMSLLINRPVKHYSCFISYSSKDDEFVHRLHADLQDKGVLCWFAPHDMKIGAKILDTLDEAIRRKDKVLLVLSECSIESDWVEDEVTKAFEEERLRGSVVLFPVRVDDAVFEAKAAWAAKLRASRNIGDFRAWKNHNAYQIALQRVLRDLQIETLSEAAAAP